MDQEKVFAMPVARVYPLLVAKAERKGRTKAEVDEITCWLTGYTPAQLEEQIAAGASYEEFFAHAPQLNPNAALITGTICGIRVENIEDPLMKKIRWLDKLVDELAKGKTMEKILRSDVPASKPAKWTCPKCGRAFARAGQDHYCGDKPKTVEEYIVAQPEEVQEELRTMHRILRAALPDAEERISWSIPTFWKGHNLVHFAAAKKHIGFYTGAEAVAQFAEELQSYKTDKGTIRIPYGQINEELITRIAVWCWETGHHA